MAFNRKQKLRDNIEAVRTAFTLDRERRTPTERERALLERYCGFGGLKCILNPARELADAVHWAKSDLELFAPTVELHRLIRENSKDETEYKRFVAIRCVWHLWSGIILSTKLCQFLRMVME